MISRRQRILWISEWPNHTFAKSEPSRSTEEGYFVENNILRLAKKNFLRVSCHTYSGKSKEEWTRAFFNS